MLNKNLLKIEFDKIIENLTNYCVTINGKKYCQNLFPFKTQEKIIKAQTETTDALILIERKGQAPISDIPNILEHILSIKNEQFLSIEGIFSIGKILKISRELKEYFFTQEPVLLDLSLNNFFENLYINKGIENEIFSSIIDNHTLDDHASNKLYTIRKEIKNSRSDIKNKLNSLLSSKYLQEPIVTIRNGRYVVPVKNEYKSEVKGFIHDISSSGSSIFVEPISVFELNNKINELEKEEIKEIEIILQKLSSKLFPISEEIENNNNIISILDFIFAKAKYSKALNATEPIITSEKIIELKNATHPLIPKEKAIPNTIVLGKDYNTLLITGPNTGGKTVTLKTVGLLTTMALSGLHITATKDSKIYPFDNIFADIGDEQSITNSLSTFSSHMTNIIDIINKSTKNSLVLVDELGSGTDPVEGANLAISILENLKRKKILTIATTHYPELKKYAMLNEKIENASCEFNIETLSPTYKLLIGVPGQSNALEISKKLGLPEKIIEYAKSLKDNNSENIEELLKKIYDDKSKIEKEKEIILEKSQNIKQLEQALIEEKTQLENNKKEIINKAKLQAKDILLDAKEDINEIISEASKTNNTKIHNDLRNKLNKKISENTLSSEKTLKPINKESIKIGLQVLVKPLNQIGEIISLPNKSNKVTIQIGNIKTNFDISNLEETKQIKKEPEIKTNTNSNFKPRQVSTELNIIGYNIEESLPIVDKFLDNALISKIENVRIVHGKGTGTLGKGIQKFLKTNPIVKSYRYGTYGEGEMGVTIVELKI